MEEHHQEMQLLSHPAPPSSSIPPPWPPNSSPKFGDRFDGPSLDLQLSISVKSPLMKPPSNYVRIRKIRDNYNDVKIIDSTTTCTVEALKWQAAEQIRLAAMERAYAERLMELTRREMELAQAEFARARGLWARAREEAVRAEKMKERAAGKKDSTCMEVTCLSCRHKFKP